MMAPDDSSYQLGVNINGDASGLVEGLQEASGLTKDIRKDVESLDSSFKTSNDRAKELAETMKTVVESVKAIKEGLEVASAIDQAFQTSLGNNLSSVREVINAVKGAGGNMSHVMSIMGTMGGGGNAVAAYGGAYRQDITSSPDFSSRTEFSTAAVGIDRYSANPFPQDFAGREAGRGGGRGGRGGRGRPPGGSGMPPGGPGFPDGGNGEEDESYASIGGRSPLVMPNDEFNIGSSVYRRPALPSQVEILKQLEDYPRMKNIIPVGKEGRSAEIAYRSLMNNLNNVSNIPLIGKAVARVASQSMNAAGITLGNIRESQASNTEPVIDPSTGLPRRYENGDIVTTRTGGIPAGVEQTTLKLANKVSEILGSGAIEAALKVAGPIGVGATIAEAAASTARQLTGFAQQQGQVFGETNYGRSLGMTLGAYAQSDFGLNPTFSAQDVMQAQMMGAGLGLKGTQLQSYVNNAIQFQTQYGLNAQQSQQILGGGLGVGVDITTNANAFGAVRNLENTTTTSTAYGNSAYMSGMTSAAAMGASPAAASYMGLNAATFGAGNLISQKAKQTGLEAMQTPLGTALFAQREGVGYMQSYAKMKSMSGQAIASANTADNMEILGWAGIKTSADVDNNAQILALILQQAGFTNIQSPQEAANWAYQVLKSSSTQAGIGAVPSLTSPKNLPTSKQLTTALQPRGGQSLKTAIPSAVAGAKNALQDFYDKYQAESNVQGFQGTTNESQAAAAYKKATSNYTNADSPYQLNQVTIELSAAAKKFLHVMTRNASTSHKGHTG